MSTQLGGRKLALLQMLAGAVILGSNGLMVRFAGVGATVSAFWRMFLAALLLAALVQWRHGWQRLPRAAWGWIAAAALAFALDLWMWHRSILLVGPGLSTLLGNAQVFFMVLAGAVFFGERISMRFLAGVLLAMSGLWLLLAGDWQQQGSDYRWGVVFGLGTGLAYAAYNISIKRVQTESGKQLARMPVEQILCLAAFGSAAALALMAQAEGTSLLLPSWQSFAILLALAAFGHCLSWGLISRAIAVLPVALVGLLLLVQPTVAYVLDVLLGLANPGLRQWAGLAVTLAGIFVAGLPSKRQWAPQGTC
ncbi:MAG: DMT family transporter [Pseudomonadota bacterium]|nr:DMT family transporter [Pseudomonadota bacterium]